VDEAAPPPLSISRLHAAWTSERERLRKLMRTGER